MTTSIVGAIAHLPLEPLVYGLAITWGCLSLIRKLKTRRYIVFAVELAIFWAIFALHGGTVTGGFAAAIASPLVAWLAFRKPERKLKPKHLPYF